MPPRRKTLDHSPKIDRWAAEHRAYVGLKLNEPFFIPFWQRLPDFVDVSPWNGNPNIAGWRFDADNHMEAVPR